MKILIIIPAYNEEENIEGVIKNLTDGHPGHDYVIINDGSRDGTAAICAKNCYNIISLPINLGLAGAFQTGLKYAHDHGYDFALQFDADGQHRPEYIDKLLLKASEGYDIVIGSRYIEKKKPFSLRMIGGRLISLALRLTTGRTISDPTSGMRLFNKKMIKKLALNMNCGPEPDTLCYLIRSGAAVAEIQVTMCERTAGTSYLSLSRSLGYMLRMGISILLFQRFRKIQ